MFTIYSDKFRVISFGFLSFTCKNLADQLIGLLSRVFTNGPGDLGSIPGRVIPKTLKWYLIPPCLTFSNIRYVSRVKWSNPGKGVVLSPIPQCSRNSKGSLQVALDYSRQLYNFIWW